MKIWRSKLGWSFAFLYFCAFFAAYMDYRRNSGTWMADLVLNLLAIPYILFVRVLTGDFIFEVHGFNPASLIVAALFCACFLYLAGYMLERALRAFWKRPT